MQLDRVTQFGGRTECACAIEFYQRSDLVWSYKVSRPFCCMCGRCVYVCVHVHALHTPASALISNFAISVRSNIGKANCFPFILCRKVGKISSNTHSMLQCRSHSFEMKNNLLIKFVFELTWCKNSSSNTNRKNFEHNDLDAFDHQVCAARDHPNVLSQSHPDLL